MDGQDQARGGRAEVVLRHRRIRGSISAGIDIEPAEGTADSGNLGDDLTDLLVALGEAAQERETGIAFLVDEVQFLRLRSSRR